MLKRRERWKYSALEAAVEGRAHEFEFELGGSVFDLALLDTRVLIEFDGPYHAGAEQLAIDARKEELALAAGFVVVRRNVSASSVISPITIAGL